MLKNKITVVVITVLGIWICIWQLSLLNCKSLTRKPMVIHHQTHHQKYNVEIRQNSAPKLKLNINSKLENMTGVGNILLVAYQRTGSSFLGELLTSDPRATYVFEPLIEFYCIRQYHGRSTILSLLRQIFQCDEWTLQNLNQNKTAIITLLRKTGSEPVKQFSKNRKGCLESKTRVVKTIRLRMNWAKHLLDNKQLDLKIIHLVRDPRAMLHSMDPSETWKKDAKGPEYQCKMIRRDLQIGNTLPKKRYLLIRYEDLVQNPLQTAVLIFQHFNLPFPKDLAFYVTTHTESERFFKYTHQNPSYFSTYRKSNYDFNAWKSNFSVQQIRRINKLCFDVINSLGYSLE